MLVSVIKTTSNSEHGGAILFNYDCLFFVVYIKATAALCILSLITDIIATILTGIGLRTKNQNTKYKFYRRAVLVMLVACKYPRAGQ